MKIFLANIQMCEIREKGDKVYELSAFVIKSVSWVEGTAWDSERKISALLKIHFGKGSKKDVSKYKIKNVQIIGELGQTAY